MRSLVEKLESRYLSSVPIGVVLLCLFFSLYTFTIYGQIRYGDEAERYFQARSLIEKQTFVIPFIPGEGQTGIDGNPYYQFEMGYGLLVIPFYALGRLVSNFIPLADADWIPMLFVYLSNPLMTALTCVLLFAFARAIGLTPRLAIWTTIVFGLGTTAWPYSKGLYREALQGLCLLLAVYAICKARAEETGKWFWVSAIAFGCLALTKVANLIMLPVFLGYIAITFSPSNVDWKSRARWTRAIKLVSLFLIPTLLCLTFQGLINLFKFGNFFNIGPAIVYFDPLPAFSLSGLRSGLPGLLIFPGKSLLLYAPPVLLFLPAWFEFFRRNKSDATFLLIMVIPNFLFYGAYIFWEGGSYWGPRYVVELVPLLVLPFGFLWQTGQGFTRWLWRLASIIVFGTGLFVQVLGAWTNDREYLDVTGQWIDIPGALDFFRHGGIHSLMVSLNPQGGLQASPLAWFLIALVLLCSLFLFIRLSNKESEYLRMSPWHNAALMVIAVGIPLAGLVAWLLPSYPAALAAQGNTKYVAAESFFADQRFCEAKAFYVEALYFGTAFSRQSASRFDEITPKSLGTEVAVGDLIALESNNDAMKIEQDAAVVLFEDRSLKISTPPERQVSTEADTPFFSVLGNSQYELSGWFRAAGIAGDGAAIIGWFEDNGKWRDSRNLDIAQATGTHGWLPFRQTITTAPTTRRALLKAGFSKAFGTMWIEGLQLIQVDPAQSAQTKPRCAQ